MAPLILIILAALAPAARAQTPASSLRQVYEHALAASESVAISEESLKQAAALYRRALGESLPEFSFRGSAGWEQHPSQRGPETTAGFRVSKSDLTGYRELAAVRAAKSVRGQFENARLRAEQLLLGDVAGAFFGLLLSRENVTATQQLIELADKRLVELRQRVRVGRTRDADVTAQEYQSVTLKVQLDESLRQVHERTDLLGFLVKAAVEPASTDAPLAEQRPLEAYLARLSSRPDVKAAAAAAEASDALVRVAQADRFPALGAEANWYVRQPVAQRDRWDAQVTLAVPLFSFGALKANVDASRAAARRSDLEYQQVRRLAELDIRNAYRDFSSARRQLELRRKALEYARKDYEFQNRDERRGLVTALEGLESLNRLNAARLALNSALLDARLASISLDLAAGARPLDVELLR